MHPHDYKVRFQGKVRQIIELDGKAGGIGMQEIQPSNITTDRVSENFSDDTTHENIQLVRLQKRSVGEHSDSTYNPMINQ